jgi:spore germination protein YaaH
MEGLLKSTKIPVFEGKHEKFAQWSYTFLSVCAISGWKQVLLDDNLAVPAESENLDPVTDAALLLLRKANSAAYALLTVVVKDVTGFQAIRNGCTDDLPSGSAREAWKNLIRIYQPKSTTQKFELEQKFNQCQLLKETKNPDEWFTELEHIRLLLKEDHSLNYDNDKMIQHIIYNIKAKGYETLVSMLKRDLGKKVKVDLEDLKEEIRQVYGTLKQEKTPETALAASG